MSCFCFGENIVIQSREKKVTKYNIIIKYMCAKKNIIIMKQKLK